MINVHSKEYILGQNIINETIDAYLCKENKGTIIS